MEARSVATLFQRLWDDGHRSPRPRLRFELGGGIYENIGEQIPRFLQAHRRATAISDFLFDSECMAIVGCAGGDTRGPRLDAVGFDALAATGFRAPVMESWEQRLFGDTDQPIFAVRSYDLAGEKMRRDVLLWHSIVREMPIEPCVDVVAAFLSPTRQLLFHVYDDRGADLTAMSADQLMPTYERFNDWLLDHDRPRMSRLLET